MVAAPAYPSLLGSLSAFDSYDTTTHIGTTFPNASVQLSRLLTAPNSDELIGDLAILVSHRGVVFFTDQDIKINQQKELGTRMGELSGKPATSTLHKHPISEDTPELGAEISVISSLGYVFWRPDAQREYLLCSGIARPQGRLRASRASNGWHSDITFEPVPSDYAVGFVCHSSCFVQFIMSCFHIDTQNAHPSYR